MEVQEGSDNLATMLIKKIKGESHSDYTTISSKERPPLYDLAKKYNKKYPNLPVRPVILISRITDPSGQYNRTFPKLWIEAEMVANLLPDLVLRQLLIDRLTIEYNDGTGSYYDPLTARISIKGAQDFIHEIGHHIWNSWLIRNDEPEKRIAVNNSSADDLLSRKKLTDRLIPDAHKDYALLVGACSGQFIENPSKTGLSNRKNDLEEHFARNFDYLMRGRSLDVTYQAKVKLKEMFYFFTEHGLSDREHVSFYQYLIKEAYGKGDLNMINPKDSKDGIEITRDELFRYHKSRIMFESGKCLTRSEEISLALDLSEDFIQFCMSKGALSEIRTALRQKGITQVDL